ncbi:O-methyltransferase [Pseudozobellia sp. WGM2]|uniref:O-methyltransferase n=1 Tax=Pseudozobellia sp. WGM2 TaxID=2787625 RepID=UPI001AE04F0E|nr:class I SAM-dependent methyltransferase [Pseudozobellia sp. WGM2]
MVDSNILDIPKSYKAMVRKSKEIGFTMPSDIYIGTFLKTLVASKPGGDFLELGTGIGLSLAWMLDGMNTESLLTSVDNDEKLIAIAEEYFGRDTRLRLICADGAQWIKNNSDRKFDLIFADAWPGKYSEIDEILDMVNVGGFYIIDDMVAQPNWPNGHHENVSRLVDYLEKKENFTLTKMNWSTGLIIAVRNK